MTDMTIEQMAAKIRSHADFVGSLGGSGELMDSVELSDIADAIDAHLAKAADYERAVTEQAVLTECVSVTGRDPSDVIRDVIQWHVDNAAQPVEALEFLAVAYEKSGNSLIAKALRANGPSKNAYDYEIAIKAISAALAHPRPTVPEGYLLVPVEPTDDMCRNAREKIGIGSNVAHHVWHWMIAAAPDGEVG